MRNGSRWWSTETSRRAMYCSMPPWMQRSAISGSRAWDESPHDPRSRDFRLHGTRGITHGQIHNQFGCEVACGQRPIESEAPPNELNLVDWVRECEEKGELLQVADWRLQKCYSKEEMELVLKLGLVCCQSAPEVRPCMKQVIEYLNGDKHLADDADFIFSEGESLDLASVRISYASSYEMASTSSLTGGRRINHVRVSTGFQIIWWQHDLN